MVYYKLEEDIRKALEGKEYGRNKIVVETNYNGGIEIYDFDENALIKEIEDLESQVSNLENDNESLIKERDKLEIKLAKIQRGGKRQ